MQQGSGEEFLRSRGSLKVPEVLAIRRKKAGVIRVDNVLCFLDLP